MRFARIVFAWLLFCSAAFAQVGQIPGWPPNKPFISAGGYTGPGDVLSGWKAWWGLRAYSSATRGTKLINACNSTGGVDVGCADMLSDASTGALVPQTISGIPCPGTNCTIKTFYDLSGALNCSGSVACDVTRSTVADRASLPATCVGSLACAQMQGGGGTANNYASVATFTSQAIPISFSTVAERTGSLTTALSTFAATGTFATFRTTPAIGINLGGTSQTATAADSALHSMGISVDAAGVPTFNVDGTSSSTGTTAGTNSTSGTYSITNNAGNGFVGFFMEHGVRSGAMTGTDLTNMCHNQFLYWGSATSC